MYLEELGAVPFDLTEIISFLHDTPLSAWKYRGDPESYKTRVIRENSVAFPDDSVEGLLEVVGREFFPPGYTNRVVFSCVPAGESILPHTDDFGGDVQSASYHCHIPLITDERVIMGFPDQDREVHLKQGFLYTLDAREPHYVLNPTEIDRTHLLFAYFPHNGKLN